jgi:hypothetical protein
MLGDNIHVINPGNAAANVSVSLPGASPLAVSVAPFAEQFVSFPQGTIGGPVKITSNQPVLASQRVQYYQTFNEVVARGPGEASTESYFNWFDKATPGMLGDNIHILNPGLTTVTGTVGVVRGSASTPLTFQVAPGSQTYVTFPAGTIGGPVRVLFDQPVLASQRVQYFQSFNEVPSMALRQTQLVNHLMWFDNATPGMSTDNIHIYVPRIYPVPTLNITVSVPGAAPIQMTFNGADDEVYVTFPAGTIGGPVTITTDRPVLAAQRVQYYQTFNEVWAS